MSASKSARGRFLVVDGHSMIFSWDDLRQLHDQRMELAREALCQRMQLYQDSVGGLRVVIVFDGNQGEAQSDRRPDDIQVLFSKKHGSADEIIERLACKYAADHDLTVASRDRAVLDMVSSFGAHAISANGLKDMLDGAEERFRSGNRKHFR
ncbi:MAG: putative RNA-binding protein with PIN domain [Verrucomicrobiales bacterium]|jgi:predicted RNA-binding protein with PIN domain